MIRTHLQLQLSVYDTAGMRYRGLLHFDQTSKELILVSLASKCTSDENLRTLAVKGEETSLKVKCEPVSFPMQTLPNTALFLNASRFVMWVVKMR